MANYLKRLSMRMKSLVSAGFIAIMAVPCSVFSAPGELIDPTLPSMAGAAAVRLNPVSSNRGATAAPVLQSVLVSPSRKLAVISGKTYKVGDKVGNARLIKVSINEAVLQKSDHSLQALHMHLGIEKTMIVNSPRRGSAKHNIERAVTKPERTK